MGCAPNATSFTIPQRLLLFALLFLRSSCKLLFRRHRRRSPENLLLSMSFYKLGLHFLYYFFIFIFYFILFYFLSPFLEYFVIERVFSSFDGASLVHRWGAVGESIGGFWDISWFWVIPLGPIDLLGLGFLSLVTSGLSNLQRGIFFYITRVLTPSLF